MRARSPLESSLRCLLCVCVISQWKNDEILPKMLLHFYVDYKNQKKN